MQPVRWGILSTAKIGRTKVVPGLMKSPLCNVVAVASRDEGTARAMAAELGIPKAYGSYEALLADPEIEAIYNPLPNHLHVPMTLAAAAAGKHVLCEKPIAITAGEAEQLRQRLVAGADRRSLHGPPSPAMAPGPRDHPKRRDRRAARDPDPLRLFQRRSREHPQQGGYRRGRAPRHRLLCRSSPGGISSTRSPFGRSRSWTGIRPSASTAPRAPSWISAAGGS